MTFSHFFITGCSSLGNGTNITVNEDDSCLYSSDEGVYFFKTKMTDSQS